MDAWDVYAVYGCGKGLLNCLARHVLYVAMWKVFTFCGLSGKHERNCDNTKRCQSTCYTIGNKLLPALRSSFYSSNRGRMAWLTPLLHFRRDNCWIFWTFLTWLLLFFFSFYINCIQQTWPKTHAFLQVHLPFWNVYIVENEAAILGKFQGSDNLLGNLPNAKAGTLNRRETLQDSLAKIFTDYLKKI